MTAQNRRLHRPHEAHGDASPSSPLRLTGALVGHRGKPEVDVVSAWWPDGGDPSMIGRAGRVTAVDVTSGDLRDIVSLPLRSVQRAAASGDGRSLLVVGRDDVTFWRDGAVTGRAFAVDLSVRSAALDHEGARGAVSGDNLDGRRCVVLFDRARDRARTVRGRGPVAVSRDGRLAAWAHDGQAGHVVVRSVDEDRDIATFAAPEMSSREVAALAFSPDGRHLAVAWHPGPRVLWDLVAAAPRWVNLEVDRDEGYPPLDRPDVLGFTPDGATVVHVGRSRMRALRAESGATRSSTPLNRAEWAVLSPGRDRALVRDARGLRLLEVATGRGVDLCDGHVGAVSAVAFEGDGARIVTGGRDGTLRLWRAGDGAPTTVLACDRYAVAAALFADGGRSLLSIDDQPCVRRWSLVPSGAGHRSVFPRVDTRSGAPPTHPSGLRAAVLAPDGATALLVGYGVGSWDLAQGAQRWCFDGGVSVFCRLVRAGPRPGPESACFTTKGDIVVVVSGEGRVYHLDARDGAVISTQPGLSKDLEHTTLWAGGALALSIPSGRMELRCWEPTTCAARWSIVGSPAFEAPLVVSPEGRLALGVRGSAVALVDIVRGEVIDAVDLASHHDRPTALAFSPDGRSALVGTERGAVLRVEVTAAR